MSPYQALMEESVDLYFVIGQKAVLGLLGSANYKEGQLTLDNTCCLRKTDNRVTLAPRG